VPATAPALECAPELIDAKAALVQYHDEKPRKALGAVVN
jgi:predicted trehalose synthase